ncbi:MAG: HAMP domain-containing histidine kinase [Candidatus Omnitrophota bacterium]|nr:MAG: HAMP domain-containing histidine kinase [Candidatus Omnitrophota bacterium]
MGISVITLILENPLLSVTAVLVIILVALFFYILNKAQLIPILKKNIDYLNNTIEELDQQAKLIIKSDMELKLYQEEVEDKLNKLTLLKNLILSSIHILDTEELFLQINEKIVNDLGFKKGAILNFTDLDVKLNIGFNSEETEIIQDFLTAKKQALLSLPLISADSEICKKLSLAMQSKDILVAPIKARENIYAIFILSNLLIPTDIRRAEKEIFSIICMYLGQCLDNIKLFEDLYHNKDVLEKKIKERTNELVKSLREIEVISKTKSDFISSVSHELRTPLTSVKGFSSLLVEEKFGKLPAEAKKRLEKIDENVNKLVNMVNILLDISRIESGKIEVKIAPADIVKLTKDVADFLLPQAHQKEIKLKLNLPASLNVYMDKHLIERVLTNLVNNAIKFTPAAGSITISCTKGTTHATIEVSDTGYGIEKDDAEKIFQEFYRTNHPKIKNIQGSGLGLSLVKRIIDTHKENIWVESEIGKGTSFYFTLKLEKT